jgi:hypothetical protein
MKNDNPCLITLQVDEDVLWVKHILANEVT